MIKKKILIIQVKLMKNKKLSLTYFIGAHRYTTIGGMCALRGFYPSINHFVYLLSIAMSGCGFNRGRVLAKRQKERLEYGD